MTEALAAAQPLGFALCHGWGLDAASMQPLATALLHAFPADSVQCVLFDLGFGGNPQRPHLDPDRAWIAVGHSYGLAWLLQQAASFQDATDAPTVAGNKASLVPWRAAVSINGFTRFCRQAGQAPGTPVRLLDAMLARLERDPVATVQDFRARCGSVADDPAFPLATLARDAGDAARHALQQHLLALRTLDLRLPGLPLLALATQDDAIVPPALAQACFGALDTTGARCLQQLPGDHLSLLRQPEMLADWIRTWLEITDD